MRFKFLVQVWDYIKVNNLQNPGVKGEYICDDALKEAFGQDSFKVKDVSFTSFC